MSNINIEVTKKDDRSVAQLREEGFVPGVFYGAKEESTPVIVSAADLVKTWKEAGGSAIVTLTGDADEKEALIQDIEFHPVSDKPLHVDFYVIEKGKAVHVTVPLEFVGEAPAEKLGGIVVKVMHEIEMDVRPSQIPQSIEVDVSALTELDSTVTIADLTLPESAQVSAEADAAVASITVAKEEEGEEERSIEDVEVEEKGKQEEGEGEEAQADE